MVLEKGSANRRRGRAGDEDYFYTLHSGVLCDAHCEKELVSLTRQVRWFALQVSFCFGISRKHVTEIVSLVPK